MTLTADELRRELHYDPATGIFTRAKNSGHAKAGDVAGCENKVKCWVIRVKDKLYTAHRLAWLYQTGEWPRDEIDHIDGDRLNNRFANLRDVPRSVNQQNLRRAKADSTTGVLGVSPTENGRYRARIQVDGKQVVLGRFDSMEAASAEYLKAKRRLHQGCTL